MPTAKQLKLITNFATGGENPKNSLNENARYDAKTSMARRIDPCHRIWRIVFMEVTMSLDTARTVGLCQGALLQ